MTWIKIEPELPATINDLVKLIVDRSKPQKVILFGSRATGKARPNSDYDLAILGKTCSKDDWNRLLLELESMPITLQQFDLVEYEEIGTDYQKQINAEGKVIYESND